MILLHYCELDRQPATGLQYVMVRFSCGDPPREQAQWQMTLSDWQQFLALLKPSRSLEVVDVPLTQWRASDAKVYDFRSFGPDDGPVRG